MVGFGWKANFDCYTISRMTRWLNSATALVADFATIEVRGRLPIAILLLIQIVVFWVSLDWIEISALCTATKSGAWAWIGYIHSLFLPLLVLGFVSAYVRRLRPYYATLLVLGLTILPLQVWLIRNGSLYCDSL